MPSLAHEICDQIPLLFEQIMGCFQKAEVGLLLAEGLKDFLYLLIQCPLSIFRSRVLRQEA